MFSRLAVFLFFFHCMYTISYAQANNCEVVAKMLPDNDVTVSSYTNLIYQNASINATDYQFLLNGWPQQKNRPCNIGSGVGLVHVQLVAYNQGCTDTASSFYLNTGISPTGNDHPQRSYGFAGRTQEITSLTKTQTDGYIITGRRIGSFNYRDFNEGVIIKTSAKGCIEWSRKYIERYDSDILGAKESPNGDVFLMALHGNTGAISKLSSTGGLLWAKQLADPNGKLQLPTAMEPTDDGGLLVISSEIYVGTPLFVTRLDPSGNILWQKLLNFRNAYGRNMLGLLVKDGYLYVGGNFDAVASNHDAYIFKMKISNGDVSWIHRYKNSNQHMTIGNMAITEDKNILVGITSGTEISNRATVGGFMLMDDEGNPITSKLITEEYVVNNIMSPYASNGSKVIRSGSGFYIISYGGHTINGLQGDGRDGKVMRLNNDLSVDWLAGGGGVGAARYFYLAAGSNGSVMMGGNAFGRGTNRDDFRNNINLLPLAAADRTGYRSCRLSEITPYTQAINVIKTVEAFNEDRISLGTANSVPFELADAYPELRYECADYVEACSYAKLTGPKYVCNLNNQYEFTFHKSTECNQSFIVEPSGNASIIEQEKDLFKIRFKSTGRHVLYIKNSLSCLPVLDSFVVIAGTGLPPPNLGNDITLCKNNSTTLHAGSLYSSYRWQDGSADSLLLVSKPGKYWVEVSDSCGNVSGDTLEVLEAPAVPVSLGNDLSICAGDTVQLVAESGFLNYQWSPAYNISSLTLSSVKVAPFVDTSYLIKVEKTPGSFGIDSIRISVNRAPLIDLGKDTSFCSGQSVQLAVTPSFNSYSWNTGSNASLINVNSAGAYSVIATDANNCTSKDTIRILAVHPLPQPLLDKNPSICAGNVKTLNAGAGYTSYQWSTGSSEPQINVSSMGSYNVVVTDQNGCTGSDNTLITTIRPLPADFLISDTSICLNTSITLRSLQSFKSYHWNNGNQTNMINITSPGLYKLEVTDAAGCIGTDSTMIIKKDGCIIGVYVPTAFSPNNDGRNDEFKPLVYEAISKYDFSILNRWGQVIFHSKDPGKGWNGTIKGIKQDSGVFIWTLVYQLNNSSVQKISGTVMLLQ